MSEFAVRTCVEQVEEGTQPSPPTALEFTDTEKVFDPKEVYQDAANATVLYRNRLEMAHGARYVLSIRALELGRAADA